MSGRVNLWALNTKDVGGVEVMILRFYKNNRVVYTEGIYPEDIDIEAFSKKATKLNPSGRTYAEWLVMDRIC